MHYRIGISYHFFLFPTALNISKMFKLQVFSIGLILFLVFNPTNSIEQQFKKRIISNFDPNAIAFFKNNSEYRGTLPIEYYVGHRISGKFDCNDFPMGKNYNLHKIN